MIVCRNVLIYFNPATQRKMMTLFHFGLRTGGILFLGPSESVGELEEEFDVIRSALEGVSQTPRHPAASWHRPGHDAFVGNGHAVCGIRWPVPGSGDPQLPDVYEGLLTRYVPPSLLLNEHHELVHSFGDARRFLQVPEGKATSDVLKMMDNTLRIAVSSALHQAAKANEPVVYSGVRTPLTARIVS